MKKKYILGCFLLITSLFFSAFSAEKNNIDKKIIIKVAGPASPPSLPLLRMIDGKTMGKNIEIEFNKWASIETLMGFANNNQISFIAVPLNSSATMYNKGLKIKLTNVNTWSVMGIVTRDKTINSWEDLKGKTIYIPMKSSTMDYITQAFMKEHGLDPLKDLNIVYSQLPEILQLTLSGKADIALTLEPHKTLMLNKIEGLREILNFKEEWQKLSGLSSDLPNAGLIAKSDFLDNNKELSEEFQKKYKEALEWVLKNPEETGKLAEKYLGLDKDLVADSVPRMALEFKSAKDSKEELEKYFKILFDYDPDSIGGKLPDEGLYY